MSNEQVWREGMTEPGEALKEGDLEEVHLQPGPREVTDKCGLSSWRRGKRLQAAGVVKLESALTCLSVKTAGQL